MTRLSFGIAAFALLALGSVAARAEALPDAEGRYELDEGLVVERWRAPATKSIPSPPLVSFVRLDPRFYSLRLLTAQNYGGSRTAPQWRQDFDLIGVINAAMYLPNGRSAGLMIDGDRVNNGFDNPAYGGFFCFDPRQAGLPAVVLEGRPCEDFDLARLREDYRVVVQGYRLLGCEGEPIPWSDRKLYSTAAIGLDEAGWVVLIHTGTAYGMSELTEWLAEAPFPLVSAMFVEGGSHASLALELQDRSLEQVGSRSMSPTPRLDFREVPNVIGFRRVGSSR